jgi:hypothetical protein
MSKRPVESAPAPGGHPREFLLEQLAFEPEAADPGVRAHVEGCDACRAVVAGLDGGRQAFVAARPARPFMAGVVERAEDEARSARPGWLVALLNPRWLLVPAAAGAAALILVLAVTNRAPVGDERIHFKGGGATLRLFYARGTAVARPLDPGVSLRPGDLLRFGVISAKGRFAAVASVDEAGRFSRYYPAGGVGAGPLQSGGDLQLLPGSIELDETTGREWIVLLLSERPLDEARVREALLTAWRARQGDRLGSLGLEAEADVVPVDKASR